MDKIYEYAGEDMPVLLQIRVAVHLFYCPQCAQEAERFEAARDIMRNEFFPASPGLEESLIGKILAEETGEEELSETETGVSFKGWVITGIIIFLSLSTSFFGLDFTRVAVREGISFLLPMGIMIGAILTIYGAIFIGSHLKELSEWFGLR
jgi:hypothetical protein